MIDIQAEVRRAERAVQRAGYSVSDLCAAAKVHRATWQRHKSGEISPLLDTWTRIEEAVRKLVANPVPKKLRQKPRSQPQNLPR